MTTAANNSKSVAPSDELPDGWVELPVQRLIEKHFCGPSPDCEERQIQTEREWGVLKTTAIVWDGWNEAAHKTLPRSFWELNHLQVQHGDVLITKAGPRDRVAVVVHVTTHPRRIVVSGKMIALRPRRDAVVPQVLAGVLGLRKTQDFIHGRTTGMAESQVNFANTVVLEAKVRVPREMPEQSRIAEILDTLDAAIRETEAVVAKLRQVKAGVLHDLLTRGLDEHGQLRDSTRHPEQFQDSEVGRIPKSWNVRFLENLCSVIVDGVHKTPVYRATGIPFLTVENLTKTNGISFDGVRFISQTDHREFCRRVAPQTGDVLVSKDGTLGVARVVENETPNFSIFVSIALLRPAKGQCSSQFLHLFFETSSFLNQLGWLSSGTGLKHIHLEHFRAFRIATPSPEEQSFICGAVEQFTDRLRAEEHELSKLHSLKRGLAHDLLTGGVRVKLGDKAK